MSCQNEQDFCVDAGETFHPIIRWGTDTIISKPITGISQTAPVVITAVAHGVPEGWQVSIVSAQGMTQINATRYPPRGKDLYRATQLTLDTIAINGINAADFSLYTGGGFLVYNTPIDLTGATATMPIWDNPGKEGTPLLTLTETSGIILDNLTHTINPSFATTGLSWDIGYYDLSVTDGGGITTSVLEGVITIE